MGHVVTGYQQWQADVYIKMQPCQGSFVLSTLHGFCCVLSITTAANRLGQSRLYILPKQVMNIVNFLNELASQRVK